MKVSELKILKNETIYKRILDELRLVGLDKLQIKKEEQIDYLDIIIDVIDFLTINKKKLKNLNEEQYENITVIIIDEIFEKFEIDVNEENIEKILKLLKNSLLVQKLSKYIYVNIKKIFTRINLKCCSKKTAEDVVIEIV